MDLAYRGKHIVNGYARWFRVDSGCALIEVLKLGVELDPCRVERLRTTLREPERAGRHSIRPWPRSSLEPDRVPPKSEIVVEVFAEPLPTAT